MHELSICQALIKQVAVIAKQHNADEVSRILVQIGPLAGVVPELLERAFFVANKNTIAEHSVLVIESLPIRVSCDQCGAQTDAQANRLLCGKCGDWHTKLLSGDELLLASVELTTSTPIANTV